MRINYPYQKRSKELARKKKQDEKRQRKLDKKNTQLQEDSRQVSNEGAVVEPLP